MVQVEVAALVQQVLLEQRLRRVMVVLVHLTQLVVQQ
jgi:hypothetical protein